MEDESTNYFDMNLKGVYKLNKTAHLRLNLFINTLEKRQEQSMVRLDHDIRETKRTIAKIEDEKNKLVMKLLKSYVQKTQKKKRSRLPDSTVQSRSGNKTGFTFSTYLDIPEESLTTSGYHTTGSYYKRPHSIPARPVGSTKNSSIYGGNKTLSELAFPMRHFSRDTNRQDLLSRTSKLTETARNEMRSQVSSRRDSQSRISTKRDIHSRVSKTSLISDLPATRGQTLGVGHSELIHNQKVKEMLGGNTCLFRGHPPARGYDIEPLYKQDKGILPSKIHPDDMIQPEKLLERIKIFGNVKLPNIKPRMGDMIKEEYFVSPGRYKPSLPPVLPTTKKPYKSALKPFRYK